jgi:hypothetical protein
MSEAVIAQRELVITRTFRRAPFKSIGEGDSRQGGWGGDFDRLQLALAQTWRRR